MNDDKLESAYRSKPVNYFTGVREDMVAKLADNQNARFLEIGCGTGDTGQFALERGKCSEYYGIELSHRAADRAQDKLTGVLVGNVETLEFPWPAEHFDALIMSEVLEHLVDPWGVLKKLNPLLKDGAIILASSPNISHYKVILSLLRGRWDLTDTGVMDRTHLRWFTPSAYRNMFEECGFEIVTIQPVVPFSRKVSLFNKMTAHSLSHLFMRQIFLIAHKTTSG